MDNRTSSPPLKEAFAAGVLSTGVDVVDIGVNHTPLLYFAVAHWGLDGGATVTGSHNPVSDNGVKMVHAGRGAPHRGGDPGPARRDPEPAASSAVTGAARTAIPARSTSRRSRRGSAWRGRSRSWWTRATASRAASPPSCCGASAARWSSSTASPTATSPITCPIPRWRRTPVDLVAKVLEVAADAGIAYDGDADRVGVIDERGRRHEADLVLALLARDLLVRHPGAEIVFDVKSSQVLIDDLLAHGGRPVMWKTGHSLLKRKMREDKILLGGEVSGHMFFAENWYGVDDGILASCRFLELVAKTAATVSSHFDSLPHLFNTPELKAPCPDDKKFAVVRELAGEMKARYETIDIDGVRILFPEGWGLVRASNTNPYLTLRFEGRTQAAVDDMKGQVYAALRRYPFVTLPAVADAEKHPAGLDLLSILRIFPRR